MKTKKTIAIEDAFACLVSNSLYHTGRSYYFTEGRYDLFNDYYTVVSEENADGSTGNRLF